MLKAKKKIIIKIYSLHWKLEELSFDEVDFTPCFREKFKISSVACTLKVNINKQKKSSSIWNVYDIQISSSFMPPQCWPANFDVSLFIFRFVHRSLCLRFTEECELYMNFYRHEWDWACNWSKQQQKETQRELIRIITCPMVHYCQFYEKHYQRQ